MRLKGRHWVIVWLLVFLCVLLAIAARQTAGFRTARRLRELREERTALEARRAEYERRIRQGSSRQVLVPVAEGALGLHQPSDSEFVLFVLPPAEPGIP
ncbi:MAG: hypothetical protein ACREMX_18625 [Gemmatimonadales bacterium]